MKEVRLTPGAIRDLADIRRHTNRTWGPAQANAYLRALGAKFQAIATGTAAVRSADELVRGYKRARHGSHIIFFMEDAQSVRIVRLLHVRSDVARRLEDEK